jgi:hypothetical protein
VSFGHLGMNNLSTACQLRPIAFDKTFAAYLVIKNSLNQSSDLGAYVFLAYDDIPSPSLPDQSHSFTTVPRQSPRNLDRLDYCPEAVAKAELEELEVL